MSLPRLVNSVSFLLVCFKICLSVVAKKVEARLGGKFKIDWEIPTELRKFPC